MGIMTRILISLFIILLPGVFQLTTIISVSFVVDKGDVIFETYLRGLEEVLIYT